MSEASAGAAPAPMAVSQEGDNSRTPREGEISAPTSLLKVLQELRKEGLIVPSRQITRMIQEEQHVLKIKATGEGRPPLLTQLVEQILEYCRLKLLAQEFNLVDLEEKGGAAESGVAASGAEDHEERLAALLRRCTETYGQLLLAHSETKPPNRRRAKAVGEGSSHSPGSPRKGGDDSGEDAERSPRTPRKIERLAELSPKQRAQKLAGYSPGVNGRVTGPPLHHPTPFYETVYALVARAVQQGMRAAAEGSRLSQEKGGFAQLAARVEEELGRLFRSHEFGRSSGRGLRKGGAKVDAGGGTEGVESAQLAARAEAELNNLIKSASQLKTRLNLEFGQLQERLQRHAQAEEKKIADQADKTPAGGADSKEALAGGGDHSASAASVDALIAGFWARSIPRQKDLTLTLQHVVSTRSPMINSLLPSPHEQALSVKQKMSPNSKRQNDTSQRAQLNGGHIVGNARFVSAVPSEALDDGGAVPAFKNTWALQQAASGHVGATPAFKNTWALAQERIPHNATRQQLPAPPPLYA